MRLFTLVIVAILGIVFTGCSGDEDSKDLNTSNASLAEGHQNSHASSSSDVNVDKEDINKQESADSNNDKEETSEQPANSVHDSVISEEPSNEKVDACIPVDDGKLLFETNIGNYIEEENDPNLQKPWVQYIHSQDEAGELIHTYKLNAKVEEKLTQVDYNNRMITAVYIGFRSVGGHKFNISEICENKPVSLEIISAPAMDDSESNTLVFMELPSHLKKVEVISVEKEVPFEEYEKYPLLPELY